MVRVFAQIRSKPECTEALRGILQKLVQTSRAEAGVLTYELFESEDGTFLFREEYADAGALEKHKNARHVAVAFGRAAPLTDGELSLWVVEPVL